MGGEASSPAGPDEGPEVESTRDRHSRELIVTASGALRRLAAPLTAVLLAAPGLGGAARAADQTEFWPEISAFARLSQRTRVYLDLSYARGKESFNQALDVVACVDVSMVPILRPVLRQEDWGRNRYFWSRIGYTHVFKAEGGVPSPAEDRGIVSFYGKYDLPGQVWLEGRARADLRVIEDQYSTRYRARGEATREFTLFDHPVTRISTASGSMTRATTAGRAPSPWEARRSRSTSASASNCTWRGRWTGSRRSPR
jgi:hypothetical protein